MYVVVKLSYSNIYEVVANRCMAYVVSMGLGLLSQTSNMVKRKVELAKKAAYGMGIWDFVQDLKKELEDPTDSIETIISTHVSAGHGDLMTKSASVS